MSGGVDSSVAAYLMQRQGYDCTGITMKLYDNEAIGEPRESSCCSLADIDDARCVCTRLGIPYYVFNFTETFATAVIDRFIDAYTHGATPNPCIDCNRYLKFERLLRRAQETNFAYVVTGHYARRSYDEKTGRYLLRKGLDANKDQSYVLYALTQEQLAQTLFPLGEYTKEQARRFAQEQGFANASKHESQDICFVPDGNYAAFIRRYTEQGGGSLATPCLEKADPARDLFPPGALVDTEGRVLGRHDGIINFTVGQRKGIGIAAAHPLYVVSIDPDTHTVVVGESSRLYNTTALVTNCNLIACDRLDAPLKAQVKHRYRQAERSATIEQLDADTLKVVFDTPQKALTKGQALVIYQGDVVVGGGTISAVL
jgi:tRNA-specific 2-thiouridylase